MKQTVKGLPKKVRVAWADFAIEVARISEMEDDNLGLCKPRYSTIYIDTDQSDDAALDTVVHEILHAVWYTQNLNDKAKEEDAVTSLAHGLILLFRDNPKLLDWFVREIKKRQKHGHR